ncbi:MAG: hypothetical protein WHW07_04050 [Bacteroidales bacterium]|jgi:hypothetical protein|nr:hypothetical protein [Bacteroidales bacterium]HOL98652.1 hypothetical protein [Bacteroidales bacterium]HOM35899.1 hypothetical protein [Bacteroidales bacterium]HPD24471.1 hypothetical protein [Bacteroidales bacterium]HRT00319.1 hypothetical protein [Bacteroidales bacterium]
MKKIVFVLLLNLASTMIYSQFITEKNITDLTKIDSEFEYNPELLQQIPGTSIKIQAPEHFLFSENIPGFIHPGTSSTIQIQEIIGTSWVMIRQAMTPEHFESQGTHLVSQTEITMQDGKSGILYLVEFQANGYDYERLMLFAGDYHNTIWINANYPKSTKSVIRDILIESILTAQFVK